MYGRICLMVFGIGIVKERGKKGKVYYCCKGKACDGMGWDGMDYFVCLFCVISSIPILYKD